MAYTGKSIRNELVFAKQVVNWLVRRKHLRGMELSTLEIRRAESQRPYCWLPEEVAAMIAHCDEKPELHWLANVIVALLRAKASRGSA